MRPSPARGFTLVEVLFTIALVSLIAATGTFTYRAVFSKGNDRAGTVSLAGLQASARGVAARNGYTYPLDLRNRISASATTSPLVDASEPSVLDSNQASLGVYELKDPRVPGQYTTAVFAFASSSTRDGRVRCVFLVDDVDGRTLWARDDDMESYNCRADALARSDTPLRTRPATEPPEPPAFAPNTPAETQRPLRPDLLAQITGSAASPTILDLG